MRQLIAEIGSANGDLQYALDCVAEFTDAGASHIKGQLYTADTLVTRDAKPYGKGLSEPATQHEMFSKTLTYDDWFVVKELCDTVGVKFFGSVFDLDAVNAGVQQKWDVFKIASGDITYRRLIQHTVNACIETDAELILSTGGSTLEEIERAVSWVVEVRGASSADKLTLLVCTLSYPTDYADANVSRIQSLQHATIQVGYSDHTRGLAAADYAYRIGATLVEKHVTLTPGAGGDHDFAVTPAQVQALISGNVPTDATVDALVAGDPWIGPIDVEQSARRLARRSPHTTRDIVAGEQVDGSNTVMLRPASGIDPWQLPMTAAVDIRCGAVVTDGLVT